jgi:DNA polymerase sigma
MGQSFDSEEAKKFLQVKEEQEKQQKEQERIALLQTVTSSLKKEFEGSSVEVYLIGSILKPFLFSSRSDIDIVLKNYKEDRFDFWAQFERKIGRTVEVIVFETSPFQEFVLKEGFKIYP